jgi:hypothetical protein
MTRFFSCLSIVLAGLIMLGGCSATMPNTSRDHTPTNIPSMQEQMALAPRSGQTLEVFDTRSQQTIQAVFGRAYYSASGKLCGPIIYHHLNTSQQMHSVACLNGDNEWEKNTLDIKLIQIQ